MNCDVKFSKKQQKKAQTTDNESQRRDRDNEHVKSYDIEQAKRNEVERNIIKQCFRSLSWLSPSQSIVHFCRLLSI